MGPGNSQEGGHTGTLLRSKPEAKRLPSQRNSLVANFWAATVEAKILCVDANIGQLRILYPEEIHSNTGTSLISVIKCFPCRMCHRDKFMYCSSCIVNEPGYESSVVTAMRHSDGHVCPLLDSALWAGLRKSYRTFFLLAHWVLSFVVKVCFILLTERVGG